MSYHFCVSSFCLKQNVRHSALLCSLKKALALFGISMLLAFDIQFLYTDCDS